MKIVVVGGTGLIGSKVVKILSERGHQVVAASPSSGVNAITREGLGDAVVGASAVIDVSNPPARDAATAMQFFTTSSHNLLTAELAVGVRHHVALSIVGADRAPGQGYYEAKVAQERLIEVSGVPYTTVRATQFFEFLAGIADASTVDGIVRVPFGLLQPVAGEDVAMFLAEIVVGKPKNGIVEIAGPERATFHETMARYLKAVGDRRKVAADPDARYFGRRLAEKSLVPFGKARLGRHGLEEWLRLSNPIGA